MRAHRGCPSVRLQVHTRYFYPVEEKLSTLPRRSPSTRYPRVSPRGCKQSTWPAAGPAARAGSSSPRRRRHYFPPTTSAQRGQSASEDSAVYFQQRGHFSLVVGVTITLYSDSSRMSPPVEGNTRWFCGCSFLELPPSCCGKVSRDIQMQPRQSHSRREQRLLRPREAN